MSNRCMERFETVSYKIHNILYIFDSRDRTVFCPYKFTSVYFI